MCPFCLSTIGLAVASVVSAGGLTALAVKVSRKKENPKEVVLDSNERSSQDVNPNSR
jgi:hypothetical protein